MDTWLDHRIFRDWRLLFNEFLLVDWIAVAAYGFLVGLCIAWVFWRVSKKKIKQLKVDLTSLEDGLELIESSKTKNTEPVERIKQDQDLGNNDPEPIAGPAGDIFKDDEDADRVVFIMDISKSMDHKNKLNTCQERLKEEIGKLDPEAEYQVIFFADTARFADQEPTESGEPNTNRKWRKATLKNKKGTCDNIDLVETRYGNRWDLPFKMATNLKDPPKRIDFLTDGEKDDAELLASSIIQMVKRVGVDKIKVNTIALMAPKSSAPLKHISEQTGGKHLFVAEQ